MNNGTTIAKVKYVGDFVLRFRKNCNLNSPILKGVTPNEIGYCFMDSRAVADSFVWKRYLFLVEGSLEIGWCALVEGANFEYDTSSDISIDAEIAELEHTLDMLRRKFRI